MKKALIFLILFYVALIALMPKANLFYMVQNRIAAERIMIEQERLSDYFYALRGEGATVFYDGIASVEAEQFWLKPWGIYNSVEASNVSASQSLKSMFAFSATHLKISYGVWNPKLVSLFAEGDFGTLKGSFDISSAVLKVMIEPSEAFSKTDLFRQYFKKSEEGYLYESKIR